MLSLSGITLMFLLVLVLLSVILHMVVAGLMSATRLLVRLARRQRQTLEVGQPSVDHESVEVFRSN